MAYNYATERNYVFSEEGQKMFLEVRDKVDELLKKAGAFQMCRAWEGISAGAYSTWEAMACVDRLIELGEIREVSGPEATGQERTFVRGSRR